MLIITVESDATTVTFRLAGRLGEQGVRELTRTWSASTAERPRRRALFDVAAVTSVDARGQAFLAEVHRDGHALVGGLAPGALVEETRGQRPRPGY